MITNGTLLHKHMNCLEQFNTIILSMDGVGDVYEKHRKIPFAQFVESVREFVQVREEACQRVPKHGKGPLILR